MKLETKIYEEINLVARDVSRLRGRHVECGGFLVADKDRVIATIIPPIEEQNITPNSANLSRHFKTAFVQAYKTGYELVGMWHSHGSIPTFHSEPDKTTIKLFLENIESYKTYIQDWSINKVNNYEIEIYNKLYKGYRIKFSKPVDNLIKHIKAFKENVNNCFYSLVINKESYDKDYYQALKHKKYDAVVAKLDKNKLVLKNDSVKVVKPSVSYYFSNEDIFLKAKERVRVTQFESYEAWLAYVKPRLELMKKLNRKKMLQKVSKNKLLLDRKLEIILRDCPVDEFISSIETVDKISDERVKAIIREKVGKDENRNQKLMQELNESDTENGDGKKAA